MKKYLIISENDARAIMGKHGLSEEEVSSFQEINEDNVEDFMGSNIVRDLPDVAEKVDTSLMENFVIQFLQSFTAYDLDKIIESWRQYENLNIYGFQNMSLKEQMVIEEFIKSL